jgi:hypothetical protein
MKFNKRAGRIIAAAAVFGVVTSGAAVQAQAVQTTEPSGPWFQGWQFQRKSICIESNIPKAPLAAVASMYRVNGIRVTVKFALGQCAAAGFKRSQYVPFTAYKADNNMCAATVINRSAGYVTDASIRINMQPDTKQANGSTRYYASACRTGAEWTDMFGHELGHAFGLTHTQPFASSIMRDGHTTDPYDDWRLTVIYRDNAY